MFGCIFNVRFSIYIYNITFSKSINYIQTISAKFKNLSGFFISIKINYSIRSKHYKLVLLN